MDLKPAGIQLYVTLMSTVSAVLAHINPVIYSSTPHLFNGLLSGIRKVKPIWIYWSKRQ